jgi:DNA-binding MarR family transcriptional regulator
MELELTQLSPKHSDPRLHAVRLLAHLGESGPTGQSALADALGMEPYAMSRLLAKLELHGCATRERTGADMVVSLPKNEQVAARCI